MSRLKSDKRKVANRAVHSTRQSDLFRGTSDPKLVKEALHRGSSEHIYKKSNGKNRSLFDYMTRTKQDKQQERPEERENMENGGTEYWSTFKR